MSGDQVNNEETVRSVHEYQDVFASGCYFGPRNEWESPVAGIAVYWGDGDTRNMSRSDNGFVTFVRTDLKAAIEALKEAGNSGVPAVRLHTNSAFVISAATQYIKKWKKNGWTTRAGRRPANLGLLKKLDETMTAIPRVQFALIAGADEDPRRAKAFEMAKQGAFNARGRQIRPRNADYYNYY